MPILCALLMVALLAKAGDPLRKMIVTLKSGEKVEYLTDELEKVSFKAKEQVLENELIKVTEIEQNRVAFTIFGGDEPYKFTFVEQGTLKTYTPEQYLAAYGYMATGEQTYEWVDGQTYNNDPISVKPGVAYSILAAGCDQSGNLTTEVYRIDFTTPAAQVAQGTVAVELADIKPTSVNVKATPGEGIDRYIVYVRDKAWYDQIIQNYGEGMMASVVERAYTSGLAKQYTEASEETWSGLKPSVEYCCIVLAYDGNGGKKLEAHTFATAENTAPGPELSVEMEKDGAKPYASAILTIKTTGSYLIRYVLLPTADIEEMRYKGKTDDEIISEKGTDLNTDQVEQAESVIGFSVAQENLWPRAEYTAIVSARNSEYATTTKTAAVRLDSIPSPKRVESALFDELEGQWQMAYTYIGRDGEQHDMVCDVDISQGVDATSRAEYRRLNRLVVTGYQFQEEQVPFYSPEDLSKYIYWKEYPELAYRDYGPKIFLEIGEGDKVTVPTSLTWRLAGYSNEWDFVAMDYENRLLAPVAFPVEVSADRNTITIKEYAAVGEYSNGTYRPAVMTNQTVFTNVAVTDIVLTRK